MIDAATFEKKLCTAFCGGLSVNIVPAGLAVSTAFLDGSGDRISFYVTENAEGFTLNDGGDFIPDLISKGISVDGKQRAQLLDSILLSADAQWDRDTFEIKSEVSSFDELVTKSVKFVSAMLRVRDIELLTKDVVRSTFREDAMQALIKAYGDKAKFEENTPVSSRYAEFPSDVVIRPNTVGSSAAAVYFINSNEKLSEALLLKAEQREKGDVGQFKVIGLLENLDLKTLSIKRFQRAQNRSLSMPIFRGDEEAAIESIGRELDIAFQKQENRLN